MAYISQYEADQDREKQRLAGLGMVLQGVQGLEENRIRALAMDEKKAERAKADELYKFKLDEEKYNADDRARDFEDRDSTKKLKLIEDRKDRRAKLFGRSGYRQTPEDKQAMTLDTNQKKIEQERLAREAEENRPLPDFEIKPGYRLDNKDREELKNANTAAQSIQITGQKLLDGIKNNGITSGLGLTRADRDADQNISEMQLQLKELFKLGAITGPDMDLINSNMGRLRGPIDMINPFNSRDDATSQIEKIIQSAMQRVSSSAKARGAEYLPARQVSPVQQAPQVDNKRAQLEELRRLKAQQSGGG